MFKNCTNLRKVDLEYFEVMNKIKYMESLFSGCKELTNISHIEVLKTNLSYMKTKIKYSKKNYLI